MLKAILLSILIAAVGGFALGILSAYLELTHEQGRILGLMLGVGVYMSIVSPAINAKFNKRHFEKDE